MTAYLLALNNSVLEPISCRAVAYRDSKPIENLDLLWWSERLLLRMLCRTSAQHCRTPLPSHQCAYFLFLHHRRGLSKITVSNMVATEWPATPAAVAMRSSNNRQKDALCRPAPCQAASTL